MQVRSKIIRSGKDRNGNSRKFISIPEVYYDDFEFGEIVEIKKLEKKEKADRMPSPAQIQKPTAQEMS